MSAKPIPPLVSVVIPVYKGELFLKEAIDSILHQTYVFFELILVDDASPDGSSSIIHQYHDDRIKYVKNEVNIGIGLSRKKGIELAKGKYIALLDQDDISYPYRLEKQVEFMEANPHIGASSGHADIIDTRGQLNGSKIEASIGKKLEVELIFQYVFNNPASIYRKDAIIKAGNFRDEYCEDYSLLIRLIEHCKIANLPVALIKYRIHGENTSIKQLDKMLDGEKACIKMILTYLGIRPTEKMVDLLYHLKPGKAIKHDVDINIYHDILASILKGNKMSNFFDQSSLKKVLAKKWLEINMLHQCGSFKTYLFSPFFSLLKFRLRYLKKIGQYKKC